MLNSLEEQFKWSVIITASVLFLGVVSGKSVKYNFEEIYQEAPCLARDGLCTPLHECPMQSRFPARGLCPRQQDQGIDCCKECECEIT
ncbi:U-scoloptoxin(19)-Sm1a-like [Plutella xylostella]|uniref:U-scoloptoxin(19)-Sm1a-like n=1 Tax=Plutella xylostella TaxID=51655 RepID=UPI002032316D|nr:U-scoloptoxin(19)-Sm1a-like [Plutella xylostella]